LDGVGRFFGLDGVILLAFLVALPANEIIVPTMVMGYLAAGEMLEIDSLAELATVLHAQGWTLVTAVCLMLFTVLRWPCSTTSWTIWRETGSVRWTLYANLLPTALGLLVCAMVANVARLFG
jgi:ferrous iron transport protein B